MIYCCKLKNRENDFVCAALIELDHQEEDDISELHRIFNDKITEYCWEEEQNDENALIILRDTLLEFSNNPNLNIGLEGNKEIVTQNIIKNKFTYRCQIENGIISFYEDCDRTYNVDYICYKSHEDYLDILNEF